MNLPVTVAARALAGDKEPVRVASTANLALTGLLSVDGVTTEVGDRVLVKDQTDATENGIYIVSEGAWRRAPDASNGRLLTRGMKVTVQEGTTNDASVWNCATVDPDFGTDDIEFEFYMNTDGVQAINDLVADSLSTIITATGVGIFGSRTLAAAATIPGGLSFLTVHGYSASGDGGAAFYKKISAPGAPQAWQFQSADGAWWQIAEKFVSPQMFGAQADATTNDAAAIQSAINAALALSVPVRVPQGIYKCTTAISATLTGVQGLAIVGAGADLTEFRFSGTATAFTFTAASGNWWLNVSPGNTFSFQGFSLSTENINTGNGFTVNGGTTEGRPPRKTLFSDVTFRGHNSATNTWARHVQLIDCGSVTFDHCRWMVSGAGEFTGVGVYIGATGSTKDPTIFNFNNCEHYYGNVWIYAEDYAEGIYLTQCTSVGASIAVSWQCPVGESGLHVAGGHFSARQFNFDLNGVHDFVIQGVLFWSGATAVVSHYSIRIQNGSRFVISSNVFIGEGTNTEIGVSIESNPAGTQFGGIITGNTFCNLTSNAILLNTDSKRVVVGQNSYNGIVSGVNVNNLGTGNTLATLP
jgi:hypothetical protein